MNVLIISTRLLLLIHNTCSTETLERENRNVIKIYSLVFSASGGMGPSATKVYSKLAFMLANKWDWPLVTLQVVLFSIKVSHHVDKGHCSTDH